MLTRKGCLKIAIALLALPLGTVILIFLGLTFNWGIPAGADWLYRYQAEFRGKLKGDRLIGGGYFFFADGRDLWIRFRVQPALSAKGSLPIANTCTAAERKIVSDWFLQHAVKRPTLLGVVPLPNKFQADREILRRDSLQCQMGTPLLHRFGQVPDICGSWVLYDPETRYYYLRYACYN